MNGRERARIAANMRWSKPGAREAQSATLKVAQRRRLVALIDPGGVMDADELDAAIVNARKAQMARVRAARKAAS